MTVRRESAADIAGIRALNDLAFGGTAEGSIVDAVGARCADALSLVAQQEGRVVGCIFFSPVELAGMAGTEAMGLAPMAVSPDRQRRGIGAGLIARGLKELRQRSCALVLGHAGYYPRFGFVPASRHGLRCQWEGVPDEAFMVRFLVPGRAVAVSGVVRYRQAYDAAVSGARRDPLPGATAHL